LSKFFGVEIKHFYDRDLKTQLIPGFEITPREAMIKVGTDLMRNHIDDKIWIKSLLNKLKSSTTDFQLVTDVRYKNEAQAIRDAGGILIYIHRENNPHVDLAANHSSETEITDENCCELGFVKVFNNSTLESFHESVDNIYEAAMNAEVTGEGFFLNPNGYKYQFPIKFISIPSDICNDVLRKMFVGVAHDPLNPSGVTLQITLEPLVFFKQHARVASDMFSEIYRRFIIKFDHECIDSRTLTDMDLFVRENIECFISHQKFGVYNFQR
jgi:hypothetical protein